MKASITRTNYEVYFIDYFDGRLDDANKQELFSFLETNTDLKEEFNRFSGIEFKDDSVVSYSGKDRLKKETITHYNYKTWLTAYTENDLTNDQKAETEVFVSKYDFAKSELELFKKIRFVPDEKIIFTKPNYLKKGGKIISLDSGFKPLAVAVAITVLFFIAYFVVQNQNHKRIEVAEKPAASIPEAPLKDTTTAEPIITVRENDTEHNKSNANQKIKPANKDIPKLLPIKNVLPQAILSQTNIQLKYKTGSYPENILKNNYLTGAEKINKLGTNNFDFGVVIEKVKRDTVFIKYKFPKFNLVNNPFFVSKGSLNDIFSEEDLAEFSNNPKCASGDNPSNFLLDLAETGLTKFSKATDISLQKEEDRSGKIVTYALDVGTNFSISHTTAK